MNLDQIGLIQSNPYGTFGQAQSQQSAQPQVPALERIQERLGSEMASLQEILGNLCITADRVFGGIPQDAKSADRVVPLPGAVPLPDGAIARIGMRLSDLETMVKLLHAAASRFNSL